MALGSGALPTALVNTVARDDFNAAMAQLDAAFPLQTVDIDLLQVTTALIDNLAVTAGKLGPEAVETAKIKLLNITAALLGPQAVETDKIKLLAVTVAQLGAEAVETAKIKLLNVTAAQIANLTIPAGKLATDCVETLKIKNLNVTPAKASLGFGRYVPRALAAVDFDQTDFTRDGNWHVDGLDLSGILPVGVVAVHLELGIKDNAADSVGQIRANATIKVENHLYNTTQVANIWAPSAQAIIYLDADRLLDYYFHNGMDLVGVRILGWFI